MTGLLRRSARADADLVEIGLYISQDSPAAAARLLDRLDAASQTLAEHPGLGRVVADRPELRTFVVGNYLVVYREIDGGVEILRVLHGRRDIRRLI